MTTSFSSHDKVKYMREFSNIHHSDFWGIVDAIGWGTKTTDHRFVNSILKEVYGDKIDLDEMYECVRDNAEEIREAAEEAEVKSGTSNFFNLSDDGWSDATCHIVGLGADAKDAFIENPSKFLKMIKEKNGAYWYVENFGYCFDAEDFE